jgi:very-short-patch-repair endonuclease
MSRNVSRARTLRRNLTDAERALWYRLRHQQLGVRFRRQHPLGNYIVDFVCLDRKLVVEVDGSQHLESQRDQERDQWLHAAGYRVLRFWNHEVLGQTQDVLEAIYRALNTPTPALPPQGGGGK